MSEPRAIPTSAVQGENNKRRKNNKKGKGTETITIDGKKFERMRMLGKGAYGKVFKVKDEEGHHYAVKKVEYKEHQGVYSDIIKEMDFLRRFSHHPNIIELCGWKWDNQVFAALMEYGGTPLHRFIADEDFEYRMEILPEVLWQMLNGLAYIHSKNVVHRDMKPDNVLIDEWIVEDSHDSHDDDHPDENYEANIRSEEHRESNEDRDRERDSRRSSYSTGESDSDSESSRTFTDDSEENIEITIKLVDFGLSKTLALRRNTPKTSTLWYRAPENLSQLKEYDTKIDIWAVGCIIYEYYTGDVLFCGNNTKDTLIKVLSTLGPNIPDSVYRRLRIDKNSLPKKWKRYRMKPFNDQKLHNLMMRCLEMNPDRRPTAQDLLQDEYFTSKDYKFDVTSFERIDKYEYNPEDKLDIAPTIATTEEFIPFTSELHREVVEWMFHISSIKYIELEYETIFLAISLFERVIRRWKDPVNTISEYKYISLACLDIASKFFEIYSVELEWVYEYNNKEHFKEQTKLYRQNPLNFKSPPKLPDINKGDLRAFVIRINRYEQRILYLLDFCVYTPTVLDVLTKENNKKLDGDKTKLSREKIIEEAKKQVYANIF